MLSLTLHVLLFLMTCHVIVFYFQWQWRLLYLLLVLLLNIGTVEFLSHTPACFAISAFWQFYDSKQASCEEWVDRHRGGCVCADKMQYSATVVPVWGIKCGKFG